MEDEGVDDVTPFDFSGDIDALDDFQVIDEYDEEDAGENKSATVISDNKAPKKGPATPLKNSTTSGGEKSKTDSSGVKKKTSDSKTSTSKSSHAPKKPSATSSKNPEKSEISPNLTKISKDESRRNTSSTSRSRQDRHYNDKNTARRRSRSRSTNRHRKPEKSESRSKNRNSESSKPSSATNKNSTDSARKSNATEKKNITPKKSPVKNENSSSSKPKKEVKKIPTPKKVETSQKKTEPKISTKKSEEEPKNSTSPKKTEPKISTKKSEEEPKNSTSPKKTEPKKSTKKPAEKPKNSSNEPKSSESISANKTAEKPAVPTTIVSEKVETSAAENTADSDAPKLPKKASVFDGDILEIDVPDDASLLGLDDLTDEPSLVDSERTATHDESQNSVQLPKTEPKAKSPTPKIQENKEKTTTDQKPARTPTKKNEKPAKPKIENPKPKQQQKQKPKEAAKPTAQKKPEQKEKPKTPSASSQKKSPSATDNKAKAIGKPIKVITSVKRTAVQKPEYLEYSVSRDLAEKFKKARIYAEYLKRRERRAMASGTPREIQKKRTPPAPVRRPPPLFGEIHEQRPYQQRNRSPSPLLSRSRGYETTRRDWTPVDAYGSHRRPQTATAPIPRRQITVSISNTRRSPPEPRRIVSTVRRRPAPAPLMSTSIAPPVPQQRREETYERSPRRPSDHQQPDDRSFFQMKNRRRSSPKFFPTEKMPPEIQIGSGRLVSDEDLARLTDVLRTYVGLDYGRQLTEEDLVAVKRSLPPGQLDDLLSTLRRAPMMTSFDGFFAKRGMPTMDRESDSDDSYDDEPTPPVQGYIERGPEFPYDDRETGDNRNYQYARKRPASPEHGVSRQHKRRSYSPTMEQMHQSQRYESAAIFPRDRSDSNRAVAQGRRSVSPRPVPGLFNAGPQQTALMELIRNFNLPPPPLFHEGGAGISYVPPQRAAQRNVAERPPNIVNEMAPPNVAYGYPVRQGLEGVGQAFLPQPLPPNAMGFWLGGPPPDQGGNRRW